MNFKDFYKELIFDIDKPFLQTFEAKQGDTKSRGFYVTVTQNNVEVPITTESMTFYCEKPDKTRVYQSATKDGNRFRIDLTNQVFAVPGILNCELTLMGPHEEKITSKTFKMLVDRSLVENSIVSEDERGVIDDALEFVEEYVPRLELIDIDSLEHYDSELKQNKVKISTVEKELNDYKRTIAGINVNQEAKQEASGYGIVSLPKNAANGQANTTIKGNTEVDEEGTKSTIGSARVKSVGKNLFDPFGKSVQNWVFVSRDSISGTNNSTWHRSIYTNENAMTGDRDITRLPKLQCGKKYFLTGESQNAQVAIIDQYGKYVTIWPFGNSYTSDTDFYIDIRRVNPSLNDGYFEIDNLMISYDNSSYEPYIEDMAYVTAKKDGKIVNLRSLPNGTQDEIDLEQGKMIKRVSDIYELKADDMVSLVTAGVNVDRVTVSIPRLNNVFPQTLGINGSFIVEGFPRETAVADQSDWDLLTNINAFGTSSTELRLFVAKGTYTSLADAQADLAGTKLTYQLAEPEIIPVQVSGSVVSHPSGTIYIDPATTVAGVYMDGIPVTHTDLPIGELERITVIDYATGLETELDVSQAVISDDKLLFTHPDLSNGDIVFFEYEYDVETTQGETTIQYYDSRYTIKDSVTGKFYKWEITVADGVPSIELVEV